MKNKFIAIIAVLTLGVNLFAQSVEQGKIIIDPYYGFPNFGKKFADGLDNGAEDIKVKGFGPCGIRAEYMLTDKVGIGADFIYNSFSITSILPTTDYITGATTNYDYKATFSRIRLQARFNYHFVENEKLDSYFGVGAGTNIRKFKETTNDPNYEESKGSGSLLPVSMRLALGMRYFFTQNIGVNAEIGLGGPVMSAGLSFKF